jgi:hypothetical protein
MDRGVCKLAEARVRLVAAGTLKCVLQYSTRLNVFWKLHESSKFCEGKGSNERWTGSQDHSKRRRVCKGLSARRFIVSRHDPENDHRTVEQFTCVPFLFMALSGAFQRSLCCTVPSHEYSPPFLHSSAQITDRSPVSSDHEPP